MKKYKIKTSTIIDILMIEYGTPGAAFPNNSYENYYIWKLLGAKTYQSVGFSSIEYNIQRIINKA